MWDDIDGLFYDRLVTPEGDVVPIKVRSMVGIIPMLAAAVVDEETDPAKHGACQAVPPPAPRPRPGRPRQAVRQRATARGAGRAGGCCWASSASTGWRGCSPSCSTSASSWRPYGLRAISAYHLDHPYELDIEGMRATIDYEPAESTTAMFGGNSNWRGPLWFPVNFLVIGALERYQRFFGDSFKIEYPTRSGNKMTMGEIAADLRLRLTSVFLNDADGRRPSFRRRRTVPDRPGLARQHVFQRVLPWRQRCRAGCHPPDRLDRCRRRYHPSPPRGRRLLGEVLRMVAGSDRGKMTTVAERVSTAFPAASSRSVRHGKKAAPTSRSLRGRPMDGALCLFDSSGPRPSAATGTRRRSVARLRTGGRAGPGIRLPRHWPLRPARGARCNPAKLLTDPYARAITGPVRYGPEVLGYAERGP